MLANVPTQLHANGCTNVHSIFTHWVDPSSPRGGICNGYRHITQPYTVTTHLFGITAYITHHLIGGSAISAAHQPQVSSQRSLPQGFTRYRPSVCYKRFPQLQEDAKGDSTMSGVGEKPSISYDLPVVEKVPGNTQVETEPFFTKVYKVQGKQGLLVARNLLNHR